MKRIITILIIIALNSLYSDPPNMSGELMITGLPANTTVSITTGVVWGADWENYPPLDQEIWNDLFSLQYTTTNTGSPIYIEFHGDGDVGEYGDGPPENEIIGYGLYTISIDDENGILLDYRDCDYWGEYHDDLYGDGDVTLTYNSSNNSLTSQNGNAYDENNPFEIWTELKDPATQNTSFFKPNNPSNLSYSIVGGHPKLNWSGSSLPSNARYKLYRNNVVVATNITTSYYTDTGVSVPGTNSFVYKVRAHLPTPYSASSTNTTNNVTVRRAQSNTNNKSLSGLLPVNLNSTNYPNPFNPSTLIAFDLPVKSNVQITIYNVLGNEIKSFGKQMFDPGNHSIFWDGKDDSGLSVSSGVYIYILRADDAVNKLTTSVSGKMILGR